MAKAKKKIVPTTGRHVRNNSDGVIVVSELNLIWNPKGSPESVHVVPEEIIATSTGLQKMLNQPIPGIDMMKLEIIDADTFELDMQEQEEGGEDYGAYLTRPQDEGITFCSGEEMTGDQCRIYTSDPNVKRPYFCVKHEYQREHTHTSPQEVTRLEPQRRVAGPPKDSPVVDPQHIMYQEGKATTVDAVDLASLEDTVEKLKVQEKGQPK